MEPPRFLPRRVPVEAYGAGGFRFGEMSHRGSLLALPSGMRAWDISDARDIDDVALAPVFDESDEIELLLLGTGRGLVPLRDTVRSRLREAKIVVEAMATGPALRTWNILLAEDRRVAAAFIAVE